MNWAGARVQGTASYRDSKRPGFKGCSLSEGPAKFETLSERMHRLGVRIGEDSKVYIRFVGLHSGIWGEMSDGLMLRARSARKELARRRVGAVRGRLLHLLHEPLEGREKSYDDLASALRAVGEHIPKNTGQSMLKVSLLLDELTTINMRIASVHVKEDEIAAKLRRLEEISEELRRRNLVLNVDHWADQAKIFVDQAISALIAGENTLACSKLVAARNVLGEKLEHQEKKVLTISDERALLISEIIRKRHERNEEVREALVGRDERHGVMKQLRESARIKEKMAEKLELALRIIDSDFTFEFEEDRKGDNPRPVGVGELAGLFKTSTVGELLVARDLLLQAEQMIGAGGDEQVKIRLAREHLSGYLEHIRQEGPMSTAQKSDISTRLLKLAHRFSNSIETVLVEARTKLEEMGEAVLAGDPKKALELADRVLEKLEESEKLVDKRGKI